MSYVFLLNKSKEINLGKLALADSFLSRFMGLMFRKDPEKGLILKLPSSRSRRGSSIHMFFMRFPLDIIFLDEDKKIVDMVSIKPWKTYTPKAPSKYVIELEEGSINKYKLEIGDEMDFTLDCV
ncbi:MAG TPA: DUF192 domain-containing protein [Methanobacterium sp.]